MIIAITLFVIIGPGQREAGYQVIETVEAASLEDQLVSLGEVEVESSPPEAVGVVISVVEIIDPSVLLGLENLLPILVKEYLIDVTYNLALIVFQRSETIDKKF